MDFHDKDAPFQWTSFKNALLIVFVVYDTLHIVSMARTKDVDGKSIFNVPMIVAIAEMYKLILSAFAMHREGKSVIADINWKRSYVFAVPGMLYAVNNNLLFRCLRELPPAIFMIIGNVKVVWTAILFWALLGRKLIFKEWTGVAMMLVGVCITQYPSLAPAGSSDAGAEVDTVLGEAYSKVGIFLSLLYTLISASASVYNEKLLKSDKGSMHAANVQLYLFGMIINGCGALSQDADLTLGMDKPLTWFVCFNMANIGLFIAAIMKYHDNLTKIGAGAVVNVVVFVISVTVVGDQQMSATFVAGATLCLYGVAVYQMEQAGK